MQMDKRSYGNYIIYTDIYFFTHLHLTPTIGFIIVHPGEQYLLYMLFHMLNVSLQNDAVFHTLWTIQAT